MENLKSKLLTLIGLMAISFYCKAQTGTATIQIDFAHSINVNSMSGFIGFPLNTCSSIDRLTPLAPKLLRTGPAPPTQPNATYHWLTSNIWGFPINDYAASGVGVPPYENLSLYASKIITTVQEFISNGVDSVVVFDIWNETTSRNFWVGTELQYHQTFETAVNAVRSILPNARIAGPSVAGFDTTTIKNLLDYCVTNDVKFDVLTWHELNREIISPGDTSAEIREVTDHLIFARTNYLNNPIYEDVGLQEIHINEFVGQPDQYRPGEYLGYLCALEAGGADLASHACWDDNHGSSNCRNCTFDGFIEPVTSLPRSKWWVNKYYADNVNTRVYSISNNTAIVSLASMNNTDTVSILVGHNRQIKSPNGTHNIKLDISNLPFNDHIRIEVKSLPNQDETVLINPPVIFDSSLTISGNRFSLLLDTIALHDVWYITITKENVVGIAKPLIKNEYVKIYPNPLTNNTTIELEGITGRWDWILYNSGGQIVQHVENINDKTLIVNKGNLKNGIYLYQIRTGNVLISSGKLIME